MRELFIYYRVAVGNLTAASAAIGAWQSQLRRLHPTLTTRLLRRPETTDGHETWMEIYATDPMIDATGVTPELQAEIEVGAIALSGLIAGPRHTEVFLSCAS